MEEDWLSNMDMEHDLLEVDVRSRSFLPNKPWSVTHRHPAWTSSKLVLEKDNPFATLSISSTAVLDNQSERQACSLCNKSRKFFCYSCSIPLPAIKDLIPCLELPMHIDIVKHPGEVDGKSTAVHAPILAPGHVSIHVFPNIPDYSKENAILVFPGSESKSLEHICEISRADNICEVSRIKSQTDSDRAFPYRKIVFIDSTWNQCHRICEDKRLRSLPRVVIQSRQTMFWRYQVGKPKEYLATIEAVYYFCVDYHKVVLGKEYKGEYDDLLFFFKFMYQKIHQLYGQ